METRPFGRTGIRVPVPGVGAMQVGDPRIVEPEAAADLDGVALRFSAFAPGVDCVIVGGADVRHQQKNVAAVSAGPLRPEQLAASRGAFTRAATNWRGLI